MKEKTCTVCSASESHMMPMSMLRKPIIDLIKKDRPEIDENGYICTEDLNKYRAKYISSLLEEEKGELSSLEKQVVKSIEDQENITKNLGEQISRKVTFGEKIADKVADFGGSWTFVIIFFASILTWMAINIIALRNPFDPYPFILLNLVLSCVAAIQAPVIMMSQNRQEARDRMRDENEYAINLKAEIEIRHLQDRLDHFIMKEWQRLLEIQIVQTDLIEELAEKDVLEKDFGKPIQK